MTAFAEPPFDVRVSLAIDGLWEDISDDVLYENSITIKRGSGFDTPRLEASNASLRLKDPTGKYMRMNPMSSLYGKLFMNQPARVDRHLLAPNTPVDAASGWSPTAEGYAWVTAGDGGSVTATDWYTDDGVYYMSLPFGTGTSGHRLALLPDATYRNIEVLGTFQPSVTDVTGTAGIIGAINGGIVLRAQSVTDYLVCRAYIYPDQTIHLTITHGNGVSFSDVTPSGLTYSGQPIRICAGIYGSSIYMKIWNDGDSEPVDWQLISNELTNYVAYLSAAGQIGYRFGRVDGNTNAAPITMGWTDLEIRTPRIVGTVPDWKPRWDKSGKFKFTPVEIAGITRKFENNKQPLNSCLRTALPGVPGLQQYWPCEDEEQSDSIGSAIPNYPPMSCGNDSGTATDFAAFSRFIASKPLPTVGDARWSGSVPDYTATGTVQLRFLQHIPAAGMDDEAIIAQMYTTGTASLWEYRYKTGGGCRIRTYDRVGNIILDTGTFSFNMNDHLCRASVEIVQDGADVDWLVSAPEEGNSSYGFNNGTLAGYTVGAAWMIRFAVGNPTVQYNDLSIGHITVQSVATSVLDIWEEFAAFNGELAYDRAERLCLENNIEFRSAGIAATNTAAMGPQGVDTVANLLNETAEADNAAIYETRVAHDSITWRMHTSLVNQDKQLILSLADHEPEDKLEPDEDPDRRYNLITAKRKKGSSFIVEQTEGSFATSLIGTQPREYTVNIARDDKLEDIANFLKHKNTVDEYLFSTIASNMNNAAIKASDEKSRAMLDLELYDRMQLIEGTNRNLFDTIEQMPRGYVEEINQFVHTFSWNTLPGSPYLILQPESTEYGNLGTTATTTVGSLTTGTTAIRVTRTGDEPQFSTTAPPSNIRINGEVMPVTSVTAPATPAYVATGAAAHADNANVTPGLPGGTTTTGDLMLILVGLRNSAMTAAATDYFVVTDIGNIVVLAKYHDGSESAPTVVVSGGSAGDTVSAQMASFRNLSSTFDVWTLAFTSNGSQQNINIPAVRKPLAKWLAVYCGWKADDWTSVATLADPAFTGAVEIGEASSTLGNDQGIVWDYLTGTDICATPASSFAVSGGGSASGAGLAMIFGDVQTVNVTRSGNDVAKTHTAGSRVDVYPWTLLGLGNPS